MTLEQVIADEREAAQVLRSKGHPHDAQLIEDLLERVQKAASDYLTWLSESDAMLRSGRSVYYLRARFAQWSADGMAEPRKGKRFYRQVIVPARSHESAARLAGLRGERSA